MAYREYETSLGHAAEDAAVAFGIFSLEEMLQQTVETWLEARGFAVHYRAEGTYFPASCRSDSHVCAQR